MSARRRAARSEPETERRSARRIGESGEGDIGVGAHELVVQQIADIGRDPDQSDAGEGPERSTGSAGECRWDGAQG